MVGGLQIIWSVSRSGAGTAKRGCFGLCWAAVGIRKLIKSGRASKSRRQDWKKRRMNVCPARDIHAERTRRSHLNYCFTPKHHGAGSRSDSRWLRTLSRPEEFAVFDMADHHQLSDSNGNLYGLRILRSGEVSQLLELGEAHEQIARFWIEGRADTPWHGHPLWPTEPEEPGNRARQNCRPPKSVFDMMVERVGMSRAKARRLRNGSHIRSL